MYCDMTETKNIYAGMCSLTPVLMFAELLCSFNLLESECSDDIILIITLKLLFMSVKPTLKHHSNERLLNCSESRRTMQSSLSLNILNIVYP